MKKYYIGLLVIGLITIGLAAYVLTIGIQGRQDKKTFERASEIAEKLNSYVDEKQEVPGDLAEANIGDVPSAIRYERLSSNEYKFCVTYKSAKGYGSSDITSTLTGAALRGAYGVEYDPSYTEDYKSSYLYVDYYYQKGENCQTIQPNFWNSYDTSETDDSSSMFGDEYLYQIYCTDDTSALSITRTIVTVWTMIQIRPSSMSYNLSR